MEYKRKIDHIVYAVPDLHAAVQNLEALFGIRVFPGGKHITQGTKNALINLGKGCYLEILAIDEENKNAEAPRWMGVDLISTSKITRWCLKSENLISDQEILKNHFPEMGTIQKGERKKEDGRLLQWQMIMPLSHPEVELTPFMVDWSGSDAHPTDSMTEQCALIGLEFTHPEPLKIQSIFNQLSTKFTVLEAPDMVIKAVIKDPTGIIHRI